MSRKKKKKLLEVIDQDKVRVRNKLVGERIYVVLLNGKLLENNGMYVFYRDKGKLEHDIAESRKDKPNEKYSYIKFFLTNLDNYWV